jgi:hypothetical protein
MNNDSFYAVLGFMCVLGIGFMLALIFQDIVMIIFQDGQ